MFQKQNYLNNHLKNLSLVLRKSKTLCLTQHPVIQMIKVLKLYNLERLEDSKDGQDLRNSNSLTLILTPVIQVIQVIHISFPCVKSDLLSLNSIHVFKKVSTTCFMYMYNFSTQLHGSSVCTTFIFYMYTQINFQTSLQQPTNKT